MSPHDLLILDDPFNGLDVASRSSLADVPAILHQQGATVVLILNRFDEIPAFTGQVGVLAECTLSHTGLHDDVLAEALVAQLAHSENPQSIMLPEADNIKEASMAATVPPLCYVMAW